MENEQLPLSLLTTNDNSFEALHPDPEFCSDLDVVSDSSLLVNTSLNDYTFISIQSKLLKVIISNVIKWNNGDIRGSQRLKTMVRVSNRLSQQIHSIKREIESLQLEVLLFQDGQKLLQQENQLSRLKFQQSCQEFSKGPPEDNDPIITQFKHVRGQWELTDENIKRIDPQTGETILHNYCKHINTTPLAIFRLLIETKGCDVNLQDGKNDTPIHIAFKNFKLQNNSNINVLVYVLLQEGIDVNLHDESRSTLVHLVCRHINTLPLEIFKLLLEIKGGDIHIQDSNNNTALHVALAEFNSNNGGDGNTLTYLLNQDGINTNTKGFNGRTLLHLACQQINIIPLNQFKLLIETHGADINVQNDNDRTPIHIALLSFRLRLGSDSTALNYVFNQQNIDVNIKDQTGFTLLHTACDNINSLPLNIFKLLIETNGADVNVQNDRDNTPLHTALNRFSPKKGGDLKTLTYLINQAGIGVHKQNHDGHNLLHLACFNLSLPFDIIKLLIEVKGVNIVDCDGYKNTPLHLSTLDLSSKLDSNLSQIVEYLIQKGIPINQKNSGERTAFDHLSSYNSTHPLTYQILVQNGAKLGKDC
jgi:ankyrin repeat protein